VDFLYPDLLKKLLKKFLAEPIKFLAKPIDIGRCKFKWIFEHPAEFLLDFSS